MYLLLLKKLTGYFSLFIWLSLATFNDFATAATPEQTYLLDIPLPTIPPANPTGKTLLVSMPQAAPGFDTPAQVYIRTPSRLEYYSKSQWVASPARMLLPLLISRLEATGQFKAILSAVTSSPIISEWRLDTEIIRLQQEFLTEPSQVRLVLRAQLLDLVARQVLATQTFEITKSAPSQDAEGGLLATNQVVAQLLKKIAEWVEKQLK